MKWKLGLILALPAIACLGVRYYLHMQVADAADAMLLKLSPHAMVSYESVTSSFDGRIGVTGIVIRPHSMTDEMTIAELTLKTPGLLYLLNLDNRMGDSEIPAELSARVVGVRVPASGPLLVALEKALYAERPQARRAARENCVTRISSLPSQQYLLSYRYIELDGELGYRFDSRADELLLHLSATQRGAYQVSAELAMPLNSLGSFALQQAFTQPKIARANLSIADEGYLPRLYDYCQREGVISREQVAELLAAEYEALFASLSIEPSDAMLADTRRFVGGGSELTVSVDPREPQALKYLDLYAPEDVHTLLNLRTRVN